MSLRYMVTGSLVLALIANAGVGVVGLTSVHFGESTPEVIAGERAHALRLQVIGVVSRPARRYRSRSAFDLGTEPLTAQRSYRSFRSWGFSQRWPKRTVKARELDEHSAGATT
jgi:hypothetical protein